MKLHLSLNEFDTEEAIKVADSISTQLALETTIFNNGIELVEPCDLSQAEIFKLGAEYGEDKTKAVLNAPEVLFLPIKYAKILEQAINNYQKQNYIRVNSIDVEYNEDVTTLATITVRPTSAHHFFGIIAQYGRLCNQLEDTMI